MAGEVVHVEFPATDIDRAQRFWSARVRLELR